MQGVIYPDPPHVAGGGAEIARPDKTAPDQTAPLKYRGHEQSSP